MCLFNSKYCKRLGIDVNDTLTVKKYQTKSEMDTSFSSTTYATSLKKLAADACPVINVKDVRAQFIDGLIYDGIMYINWLGSQITIDLPGRQLIVQK